MFGFASLTVPALLLAEKRFTHQLVQMLRHKGFGTRKAVILGTGSLGRLIFSTLARSPKLGLSPVAFVDDDTHEWGREIYECSYRRTNPVKVRGPASPELIRRLGATVVVIALPEISQDSALQLASRFAEGGLSTYFAPRDSSEPGVRIEYTDFDGVMLAHVAQEGTRLVYETSKRALDVAVSLLMIAFMSLPMTVLALLVKATSRGPVLFRQLRVGRAGVTFAILKFRSMFVDAPSYAFSPSEKSDPRITTLGRFLRKTSLDELPQLFNVLFGEMSLVGPRPEMPFIADQHSTLARDRLKVRPGITGLWQLSADRGRQIHESIEYDLYYLVNNPLFLWNISLQLARVKNYRLPQEASQP
jgi:exopolysaccharide biosynthesis polyprenyl glycosylphosphotransferase